MLPVNQIIQGNSIEVLKNFPENSIDCVVTDPPYGLNFMGKEWDRALPPKNAFKEMCRVLKPGALAFVMSSPRQDLVCRMGILLEESGFNLGQSFISWIYNSGFPKAYSISKGIDRKLGVERKIVKTIPDRWSGKGHSYQYSEQEEKEFSEITESTSDEAKKYDGWKAVSGLKPALEVIFMVQKPLSEKTIVDNVLKWGTGAMNVDACRIPIEQDEPVDLECNRTSPKSDGSKMGLFKENGKMATVTSQGRFPANLLVSDDALNDGKDTKTTYILPEYQQNRDKTGFLDLNHSGVQGYNDSGSKSRYFDLDAWAKHHGILQVPKASTSERDMGLTGEKKNLRYEDGRSHSHEIFSNTYTDSSGNPSNRGLSPQHINNHPTVKPIKLGAYLCELGCPPEGIVLDPFCGSGSFMVSAKIMSKVYIGIELDIEYHKLASERLKVDVSEYRKDIIKEVRPEKSDKKQSMAEWFN